jgi:hypothetical protein
VKPRFTTFGAFLRSCERLRRVRMHLREDLQGGFCFRAEERESFALRSRFAVLEERGNRRRWFSCLMEVAA